jgi:hypothetical protein
MGRYKKVRIGPKEMRQRFNDRGFLEPEKHGYRVIIADSGSCGANAPPDCVRSETIHFLDNQGHLIAVAHQFCRADGSIGASGKPDPKRLRDGDTLYILTLPN